MAWKKIIPSQQIRDCPTVCFRVRNDKGKPRVSLRIGSSVIRDMRWKLGEQVELLWDEEHSWFGVQRAKAGRKLVGEHASAEIGFSFPNDKIGKAILKAEGVEIEPKIVKGVLVIEMREFLQ